MKRLFIFVLLFTEILLFSRIIEVSERESIFTDESSGNEIIIEFGLDEYEIEDIERGGETFQKISCENAGEYALEGMPDIPCFSTLIAVPDFGKISYELMDSEQVVLPDMRIYPRQELQSESSIPTREFYIEEDFYHGGGIYPENRIELGEAAILRDYRVVRLTVNPFQYDASNGTVTFNRVVRVKITADDSKGVNELSKASLPSRAFSSIYAGTIVNYESFPREEEYQKESCLYIYADENQVLDYLEYLLDWRREQGYEVTAVSTAVTGSNTGSIKNYIQDAYDEWENPPEYITLVGDANGSYFIPCYWEDSGETDNGYVLLDGSDILPDASIGRLPFNSLSEFQTVLSKIISYETSPYMNNTDWFERGLMVGDPSTSGTSCVDAKMSVVDLMAAHAPDIDAVEVYSGNFSNLMTTNINQGCVYFNYRGFGDLSGWSSNSIDYLTNGFKLPCVVFLTCGTGSFAGSYDGFSEHFLKAGTSSNPKGAVAAISTATNATHTTFNNVMDVGIWTGIFADETWNMAMGLTRGKLAIYLNFPNNPANHQHQFIAWNNLMGDAVMDMWSGVPQQMIAEYPDEINMNQESITVMVTDLGGNPIENARITLLDENEVSYTALSDGSGAAVLETSELTEGTLKLTAIKHNHLPIREEIEMTSGSGYIEAVMSINDEAGNNDGLINPGESFDIEIELTNHYNSILTGIDLTIETPLTELDLNTNSMSFPDISAGGSETCLLPVTAELAGNVTGIEDVILYLHVTSDSESWVLQVNEDVIAPSFYLTEYEIDVPGVFEPGDDADMVVYLNNTGTQTASNMNIELSSLDDRISITEGESFLGQVPAGYTGNNIADPFHIFAEQGILPGTQITLMINIDTPELEHPPINFLITVGEAGSDDVLGPDSYGYYCYDESDTGYLHCPEYEWEEIDPDYGGNGTVLPFYDSGNTGDVTTIDLPIQFSFYGLEYDEISICSNGWISPGETDARDFMNYTLPGPSGPSPMIAAYWDDIQIGSGKVCYYHNPENYTFIVEWSRVDNDWDETEQTFEIILYDSNQYPTFTGDSQIKMQYNEFSNPDQGSYGGFYVYHGQFATVGIEDHTSLRGLEYTYNNQYPEQAPVITDNSAILFSTSPINQESAYLVLYEEEVIDSSGDGRIDYGDEVELKLSICNFGEETAYDVSTFAGINDEFVTLTNNTLNYPDIAGGMNIFPENGFEFEVAENCPDGHVVSMPVTIFYNETSVERIYNFIVNAPDLCGNAFYIINDDNENNLIDPGENFELILEIENNGGAPLYEPEFEIVSLAEELSFDGIINQLSVLPEETVSYVVYNAAVSDDLQEGDELQVVLNITGEMGQAAETEYNLRASMIQEGFESGDLEFLPWETGGANIFSISTHSHTGEFSAKSGEIGHQQATWIGIDINVETEGELSFWLDVSTEYDYDYVSFFIDDIQMNEWSGETGWFQMFYDISAGEHQLRWEYEKDFMVESGSDCFWLDDVSLPGVSGMMPQILLTNNAEIDFELAEGETGNDQITIYNISNELAQYEIRISGEQHDWLSVTPDEGFIAPADSIVLIAEANPQTLETGEYLAIIAVSDNFGNDMSISANLSYLGNPATNEEIVSVSRYIGNFPNPFNPQTTFQFQLAEEQNVDIDIYNLKGQKVRSLCNNIFSSGNHQVIWNGKNDQGRMLSSGIYLFRIKCKDFEAHSRVLMLK